MRSSLKQPGLSWQKPSRSRSKSVPRTDVSYLGTYIGYQIYLTNGYISTRDHTGLSTNQVTGLSVRQNSGAYILENFDFNESHKNNSQLKTLLNARNLKISLSPFLGFGSSTKTCQQCTWYDYSVNKQSSPRKSSTAVCASEFITYQVQRSLCRKY